MLNKDMIDPPKELNDTVIMAVIESIDNKLS